ncbi:hypothetical protein [Streptomyces sp. NPDC056452]|uniref:hypothetical protein n=1 Tax=Streptomyces sp. NPDC056452 TaxID=3345821 RepID=UPI0036C8B6C6
MSGNTTTRPGPVGAQTLTWNVEGELANLTEGSKTTDYLYDANGELLIRSGSGKTVTDTGLGGWRERMD